MKEISYDHNQVCIQRTTQIASIENLSNLHINLNIYVIANYEKYFIQTVRSNNSRFNTND